MGNFGIIPEIWLCLAILAIVNFMHCLSDVLCGSVLEVAPIVFYSEFLI